MKIDSVQLTRQGWIKHLATLQDMILHVEKIHGALEMTFRYAECELDRSKKISKGLVQLQELIWESGAISERIHRERAKDEDDFDAYPRDWPNERTEAQRGKVHRAAKDLEALARGLWDETAPEVVVPDAVYPGPMKDAPGAAEDRNQMKLALKPAGAGGRREPPIVDARHLVDYKMQQANDDTATPGEEDEE